MDGTTFKECIDMDVPYSAGKITFIFRTDDPELRQDEVFRFFAFSIVPFFRSSSLTYGTVCEILIHIRTRM